MYIISIIISQLITGGFPIMFLSVVVCMHISSFYILLVVVVSRLFVSLFFL